MRYIEKAVELGRSLVVKTAQKTVSFAMDLWHHWETTSLLLLSSVGLTHLIGELPFLYMLPLWVEAAMVAPVVGVCGVSLLTWIASQRLRHA